MDELKVVSHRMLSKTDGRKDRWMGWDGMDGRLDEWMDGCVIVSNNGWLGKLINSSRENLRMDSFIILF